MGLVLLRPMRWTEKAVRVRVRRRKEVHGNPRMSHFPVCCNRINVAHCSPHICVLVIEVYVMNLLKLACNVNFLKRAWGQLNLLLRRLMCFRIQ